MKVLVLGASAGGGFPQWNCNCPQCEGLRRGSLKATARTQSSIALSANGEHWLLCNASPDILTQLARTPALHPRALRESPIKAVLLVDSQIDHSTGLLMLREGCPHPVYCTDMVYRDLSTAFPLFELLKSWNGGLSYKQLSISGETFSMPELPGLNFRVYPVEGKAPPYSSHRNDPHPGDNIALVVINPQNDQRLVYAPGIYTFSAELFAEMHKAHCILIDGTFWSEDEMQRMGVGSKRAQEMGHLPQSGPEGMIEQLKQFPQARKILIHINNTNPILNEDSPERKILDQAGIEVAFDGMEIEL